MDTLFSTFDLRQPKKTSPAQMQGNNLGDPPLENESATSDTSVSPHSASQQFQSFLDTTIENGLHEPRQSDAPTIENFAIPHSDQQNSATVDGKIENDSTLETTNIALFNITNTKFPLPTSTNTTPLKLHTSNGLMGTGQNEPHLNIQIQSGDKLLNQPVPHISGVSLENGTTNTLPIDTPELTADLAKITDTAVRFGSTVSPPSSATPRPASGALPTSVQNSTPQGILSSTTAAPLEIKQKDNHHIKLPEDLSIDVKSNTLHTSIKNDGLATNFAPTSGTGVAQNLTATAANQIFVGAPSQTATVMTQVSQTLTQQLPSMFTSLGNKQGASPQPILVQLSPAELGHVHIQFSFDSAEKITAHIIAQSAETRVVLQNNSDFLAAHLKHSGFDNADISFEVKSDKSFFDTLSNGSKNNASTFTHSDTSQEKPTRPEHDLSLTETQTITKTKQQLHTHMHASVMGQLDLAL